MRAFMPLGSFSALPDASLCFALPTNPLSPQTGCLTQGQKLHLAGAPALPLQGAFADAEASIVEPRKLEHGFRRISARIPYTLP